MAVNWFEGGRRISQLFMALVGLGGAAYVAFAGIPMATLESEPGENWTVARTECGMPAHQEYLWHYDWGGDKPGLTFCFRPVDNGKIPYAVAPTPPDEAKSYAADQAKQEADDKAREARGEPPPLRMITTPPKWYYTADQFSDPVGAYAKQRVADFKMTPQLQQELFRWKKTAWWEAHWKAFIEALPWVVGLYVFIWLFTAVVGWIVRGFAGVPSGEDFRRKGD